MKALTREEVQRLESAGASMPPLFTGVWNGKHYYRGVLWDGPRNQLGSKSPRDKARDRSPQRYGRSPDIMWSGCFSAMARGL